MIFNRNRTITVLTMSAVPFFVEACYLYLSRLSGKQSSNSDTVGLIGSIIIGYLPLFWMRMKLSVRLLISFIYVIGLGFMLLVFSFAFVCIVLRDCL